ncbi:hypothetical protein ACVW0P_003707 [Mucilaginibacter sp. UYNi724]
MTECISFQKKFLNKLLIIWFVLLWNISLLEDNNTQERWKTIRT